MQRIFEVIPGFISWSIIGFFLLLFFFQPFILSIVIIIFLLYWVCRLFYMSALLLMAHHRIISRKNLPWLTMAMDVESSVPFDQINHVILYTVYKEPREVLEGSLTALNNVFYPHDKMIVILAGEERAEKSLSVLEELKRRFQGKFQDFLVTVHPKGVLGEIQAKGANATYAAKKVKEYLLTNGHRLETTVISCFDADTCPDVNYFSCLTYHFRKDPKRHRKSFQPFPVYSNNIYRAPAFARVMEMGSTFWQLIESMRHEKFITFSSHSMSFKTLVEVDYWPVNLVSDDSLIYWKCFLRYHGDYSTYPLDVPVYMDIAVGKNWFETMQVQYKQKRRWAWGVENFVFVGQRFLRDKHIPVVLKIRKLLQILDSHINWATWSILVSFITPLTLFWGKTALADSLIFFNLAYINSIIFNFLTFVLVLSIMISNEFLPPRPKEISRAIYCVFLLQWLLVPFVSAILGSFPALDAQTRLMFHKNLTFYPTPKQRPGIRAK